MKFRVRFLKPNLYEWQEVEAETSGQAAHNFHYNHPRHLGFSYVEAPTKTTRHTIYFALVEVEGHGEFVSRVYHYGLWRKGGVEDPRRGSKELLRIASELGWGRDPQELLAEGWEEEETLEDASRALHERQ